MKSRKIPSSGKPLAVLFLTVFVDLLGFGLIIPVLPIFAQDLGASSLLIGVIAASYSFMQFMFAGVWGGLSDKYGRRPIILISTLVMTVAYIVFGLSTSLILLLISRLLAGLGAANISAAQAFISDITPPENRAKNFGIIGAAFGLGFIIRPPVGGWLKDDYGIEWVGYVAAGISLLNFILAYFLLPESLLEGKAEVLQIKNPFSGLIDGLKRPIIRELLIINVIFIVAFSMMQITSTIMWEGHFGLNSKQIGYVFGFIGLLAVTIQGTLLGWFNRKLGERKLLTLGNVLVGLGLLTMPYVPIDLFVPLELISLVFLSMGNAFLAPTISSLLSQSAGKHEQGAILGVAQSSGSLGRLIGPILGGYLYGFRFDIPFLLGFFIMAFTGYLSLMLVRKKLKA